MPSPMSPPCCYSSHHQSPQHSPHPAQPPPPAIPPIPYPLPLPSTSAPVQKLRRQTQRLPEPPPGTNRPGPSPTRLTNLPQRRMRHIIQNKNHTPSYGQYINRPHYHPHPHPPRHTQAPHTAGRNIRLASP